MFWFFLKFVGLILVTFNFENKKVPGLSIC
jgi:hypothetical protein